MRFLTVVVFLFLSFSFPNALVADVIWNRGLDKGALAGGTDSLFQIVSSSARPGGVRSVELNGQKMTVLRLVNPNGDEGDFVDLWKAVKEQQGQLVDLDRVTELLTPKKTLQLLLDGAPLNSVANNLGLIFDTFEDEKEQITSNAKSLIVERLEQVSAYETPTWRALAKVPVSAIDSSNGLASTPPTDGFIVIGEKSGDSQETSSFWMFRFGEEFNIFDAMGAPRKGRPEPSGSKPQFPIAMYPASELVMSFSEQTKGWNTDLWSLESKGDVISHATHYLASFQAAGYEVANVREAQVSNALLQFRKPGIESTLFIDLIDPLTNEVSVTLQSKYPP